MQINSKLNSKPFDYLYLHGQHFENPPLLTAFPIRPGFKSFRNRQSANFKRNRIKSEMETATVLENECELRDGHALPYIFYSLAIYNFPPLILQPVFKFFLFRTHCISVFNGNDASLNKQCDPGGGTIGIAGWGCATGTLEPLACQS